MIRQGSTNFASLDIDDLRQLLGYCVYEAKTGSSAGRPDNNRVYGKEMGRGSKRFS